MSATKKAAQAAGAWALVEVGPWVLLVLAVGLGIYFAPDALKALGDLIGNAAGKGIDGAVGWFKKQWEGNLPQAGFDASGKPVTGPGAPTVGGGFGGGGGSAF